MRRNQRANRLETAPNIRAGQFRRQTVLESRATYRVVDVEDASVLVEVVEAPGLTPGRRFRFSRESVSAMRVVHETEIASPSSAVRNAGPVSLTGPATRQS